MEQSLVKSVKEAADWMAKFWSDDVTPQDNQQFEQWLAQHPNNEKAWQQLELVKNKFDQMPEPQLSKKVLLHSRHGIFRRQLLSIALVVGALSALGWRNRRSILLVGTKYETAYGETQFIELQDGTEVVLNTNSKILVDFNEAVRKIHLLRGEILVTNKHHNSKLIVSTEQGDISPLGTQFNIRQFTDETQVAVYEGKVQIIPDQATAPFVVNKNQKAQFSSKQKLFIKDVDPAELLWLEKKIIANSMLISDFMDEISRYRPGYISTASELEHLRLTGVFSVSDTDKTLTNIAKILPIKLHFLSSYLVRIDKK